MSSEYNVYYQEIACNSATWADEDADKCRCHGSGWFVSEVDTIHPCPYHRDNSPHPDDEDEWVAFSEDPEGWRKAKREKRERNRAYEKAEMDRQMGRVAEVTETDDDEIPF